MNSKKTNSKKGGVSRRDFLRYAGIAFAGSGVAASRSFAKKEPSNPTFSFKYDDIDIHGSLISVAKIDPLLSYAGDYVLHPDGQSIPRVKSISDLLADFIKSDETDVRIWESIQKRINYTYESLDDVLLPILGSTQKERVPLTLAGKTIREHIRGKKKRPPKKLLFKPNIVTADVISFGGDGAAPRNNYGLEGGGASACTHWAFLAALMRWFHDNLEISYFEMAVGEAGCSTHTWQHLYHNLYSPYWGFAYTAEAVFEGRVTDPNTGAALFYGGYPFFYVRKYLADAHPASHVDDPMQGHLQAIYGPYTPPGKAGDQLGCYDLGNAEAKTENARGREIKVPNGACYQSITIHKAIVGDPADMESYPGAVLINVPKLKVHSIELITNAIKNLGIGLWPTKSGYDDDPDSPDFKYGLPSSINTPGSCAFYPVANLKGRVYHSPWSKGLQMNCDGAIDPKSIPCFPNDGIKGSMVDINLAIRTQPDFLPYILNISDAITITNLAHGGSPFGYQNNEGLILACENPVALDLFASRYLYKNVPNGTVAKHPFAIWTSGGDVHYDAASTSIVSFEGDYEWPVENTYLYTYAESRGLGIQTYHVRGRDRTAGQKDFLLLSADGHFCRAIFNLSDKHWAKAFEQGNFKIEEVIARLQYQEYGMPLHYWSIEAGLCPLQRMLGKFAKANDALTLASFNYDPGYSAQFHAMDTNCDGKLIFGEEANEVDKIMGPFAMGYSMLGALKPERAIAHMIAKPVKYSESEWNELGAYLSDANAMVVAHGMAFQQQTDDTVDRFFNMPFGYDTNGIAHWPSLQFAKYVDSLTSLTKAHEQGNQYATSKKYSFKMYVPNTLPYFPHVATPFASIGDNVEHTSDPKLICTMKFFDATGKEVEQW